MGVRVCGCVLEFASPGNLVSLWAEGPSFYLQLSLPPMVSSVLSSPGISIPQVPLM